MVMGEPRTFHFYDFWVSEPVTKPRNQLLLSLETPGHIKQIKKYPNIFKNYDVQKSWNF